MVALYQHAKLGKIWYEKNFWNGATTIMVDDIELTRINSLMYTYDRDGIKYTVIIQGNAFSGLKLNFSTNEKNVKPIIVPMVAPFKAYEYIIAFISAILVAVWVSVGMFVPSPILKMSGVEGLICALLAFVGLAVAGRTEEAKYRMFILIITNILGLGISVLLTFI